MILFGLFMSRLSGAATARWYDPTNGAYGIYPVQSKNVLVENNVIHDTQGGAVRLQVGQLLQIALVFLGGRLTLQHLQIQR